ncbi:MAG: hypothetical protein JW797_15625 [Bradymonadales bacterium]|nr:hypothetical protein [Bradymonadales bacterium]
MRPPAPTIMVQPGASPIVQMSPEAVQRQDDESQGGTPVTRYLKQEEIPFWELGYDWNYGEALNNTEIPLTKNDIVQHARAVLSSMNNQEIVNTFLRYGDSWAYAFRKMLLAEFERKTQLEKLVEIANKLKDKYTVPQVAAFLQDLKSLQASMAGVDLGFILSDVERLITVLVYVVYYKDSLPMLQAYLSGELTRPNELMALMVKAEQLTERSLPNLLKAQEVLWDFRHAAFEAVYTLRGSLPPEIAREPWARQFMIYCQSLHNYWYLSYMTYYGGDKNRSLYQLMNVSDSVYTNIIDRLEVQPFELGPSLLDVKPVEGEMSYFDSPAEFTQALIGYFKYYNSELNDQMEADFQDKSGAELAVKYAEGSQYERTRMSQVVTAKSVEEKKRIKEEEGPDALRDGSADDNLVLSKVKDYRSSQRTAMKFRGQDFETLKSSMASQAQSVLNSAKFDVTTWKSFHKELKKEWFVNLFTDSTDDMGAIVGRMEATASRAATAVTSVSDAQKKGDLVLPLKELTLIEREIKAHAAAIKRWRNETEAKMTTIVNSLTFVRDLSIDVFKFLADKVVPGSGIITGLVLKGLAELYTESQTGGNYKRALIKLGEDALAELIGAKIKAKFPFKPSGSNVFSNLVQQTIYDHTLDTFKKTGASFVMTAISSAGEGKEPSEIMKDAFSKSWAVVKGQASPKAMATRLVKTGALQAIKIQYKAKLSVLEQRSAANQSTIRQAMANIRAMASS